MKPSNIESYLHEGLRIVDESGVDFFSEEENALLHQLEEDNNIDHFLELEIDKHFAEKEREDYLSQAYLPYI